MALSITTIFGYGVGHVLNDLCSAMWFTYLLIYFHHVMQFNNQLAGVVLLIGQIADGLSTPFVGAEADRTDDTKFCIKYGRRKTWHLVGCICVVCAFPFIFIGCIGCGSASVLAQVIYFAPFVIIFQFGWAATQISHLSLIPSITQDVNDRTVLNAIRYAFTVISNITVYLITWLTLGLGARGGGDHSTIGPNDATSFRIIVSIVLGIGFVFAALFHLLVKEDNVAVYTALPESEDCLPHCRMSWKDWFNEPQFYQIAVLYMSTRLFCNITQAYIPIYLQDSLHLPENSVAYIPLVMYSSGFLTAIAMKPVNKHLGRKVTYIIGALIGFAGCVWVWFGDGPLYIHYLLYIVAVLIGSGGSTMLVTSLSFTADLIGPNIESGAFVYGAMSFTDKLSNGLAVILIQSYAPCFKNETVNPNLFLSCSQFYRNVLAFLCSGFAILGILATLSLLPKKVGQRHRNVTYSEHTSVYSEHSSYGAIRNSVPEQASVYSENTSYGAIRNSIPDHTSIYSESTRSSLEHTSIYSEIPTSDSIKSSDSPEIKSISSDSTHYGTIEDSGSLYSLAYSGITCYGTIKDSDSPEDRVIYPESNGYGINSQVVASGISGSSSTSDRKVEDNFINI